MNNRQKKQIIKHYRKTDSIARNDFSKNFKKWLDDAQGREYKVLDALENLHDVLEDYFDYLWYDIIKDDSKLGDDMFTAEAIIRSSKAMYIKDAIRGLRYELQEFDYGINLPPMEDEEILAEGRERGWISQDDSELGPFDKIEW